jgi:lipopolysaccharide transport system ATP-binding protein
VISQAAINDRTVLAAVGSGGESSGVAVTASGLGKCFHIYERPVDRLLRFVSRSHRHRYHEKWALRNISLQIWRGECFGIIGRNGAGKSTLLKLLTGVLKPTAGTVTVSGRALGLLELGTGFNRELSGRKNVVTSARLLGFPRDYVSERIDEIEDFADIGEFFDMPVKLYSSGMLVRLAFSMYLFMQPDVFIVDEALSVGDAFFQQKCARAMARIRANGAAMLFASHDLATVQALCDRVLWIEDGQAVAIEAPGDIIARYAGSSGDGASTASLARTASSLPVVDSMDRAEVERVISAVVSNSYCRVQEKITGWEILGVRIVSAKGELTLLFRLGERVRVQVALRGPQTFRALELRAALVDRLDRTITSIGAEVVPRTVVYERDYGMALALVDMPLVVAPGDYTVVLEVVRGGDQSRASVQAGPITVYWDKPWMPFFSLVGLPTGFSIEGRVALAEVSAIRGDKQVAQTCSD